MRKLEDFMNSLTDKDWGWRPVLFLRPRKEEEIDNIVLLKMAGFFGPVAGLIIFLTRLWRIERATLPDAALALVFGCLAFFVLYKFTFAITWNRRARRLRSSHTGEEPSALPGSAADSQKLAE